MNLRILFATLLLSSHAQLNAQEKHPNTITAQPPSGEQIHRDPTSGLTGEGLALAESGNRKPESATL